MEREGSPAAYRTAIGCFICLFINLGIGYTFGVFLPYLVETTHSTLEACSLGMTVAGVTSFTASFFLPKVIKRLGVRGTFALATVIGIAYLSCEAFAENIWVLYAHSFFGGLFMAFGTATTASIAVSRWFIKRRASILGLVIGGGAFGSAVMQFLGGRLLAAYGVRTACLTLMAIMVVIPSLANLLLIREPKVIAADPGTDPSEQKKDTARELPGVMFSEARRSLIFWILMVCVLLYAAMIAGYQTFATSFWRSTGMEGSAASSWLSLWSVIGCAATILLGQVAGRFGNKTFSSIVLGGFALGLIAASVYASNGSSVLLIAMIVLTGLGYPLNSAMHTTITTEVFGPRDYDHIVSWLSAAFFAGRALSSPLLTVLLGSLNGSYSRLFLIFGILSVIVLALLLISMIRAPYKNEK